MSGQAGAALPTGQEPYWATLPSMKTITQREFCNSSAAVMDAVEAGETYHITRNGAEAAELRPLRRRRG